MISFKRSKGEEVSATKYANFGGLPNIDRQKMVGDYLIEFKVDYQALGGVLIIDGLRWNYPMSEKGLWLYFYLTTPERVEEFVAL